MRNQSFPLARWGLLATLPVALWAFAPVSGQVPTPPQAPPRTDRNFLQTVEGPALFQMHCAVCHGKDAAGEGPAAAALKNPVPDLTRISQRNGGKFPLDKVQLTIAGDVVPSPAHGSREMPIWGPVFSQIEWDQNLGKIRIYNLAKYLESIQRN
jgi:mono/diheme cytochrome c family protein